MAISVGDALPNATVYVWQEGPTAIASSTLFEGKKVVLFAVPGAFTPGCSMTHLPGFVVHVDEIKAKGVDTVICMAVNDPFVMKAWGEAQNAEHLLMLSDSDAALTQALDLSLDVSGAGLGIRSQRFALIVDNGIVTYTGIEPGKEISVSSAEAVMAALDA